MSVYLTVRCLSVGRVRQLFSNGWTYWDTIRRVDSSGPQEPCVRRGLGSASRGGALSGVIIGHAQTCSWSIFSTPFSDAASGVTRVTSQGVTPHPPGVAVYSRNLFLRCVHSTETELIDACFPMGVFTAHANWPSSNRPSFAAANRVVTLTLVTNERVV